ncbi:MAG: divergent polysaccharide deacetylase family protein [Candidatus Atribacteria bacterium]|nr:divergent polysaccharide deacetylase family protein [Candidatus Atribacteria bacterium]
MKKGKQSRSKSVFWILVFFVLLCSFILVFALWKEGLIRNRYIALAKVIPSQQEKWLTLFIFQEIYDVFPDAEIDASENPESNGYWKVRLKLPSPEGRILLSRRMEAVFSILSGFGLYGEKRTKKGSDYYLLFRDLTPWIVLEVRYGPLYQVALVIDDFGYNLEEARMFLRFPIKMNFSIFPHLPLSRQIAEMVAKKGDEVLIHLPMEAVQDSQNQRETFLLRTGTSDVTMGEMVRSALQSMPMAKGINNHKGSRATQDLNLMKEFMVHLQGSHLYFLDSVTIGNSRASEAAIEKGVRSYRRDVFLDGSSSTEDILQQLRETVAVARKKGYAIAIGHARTNTYLTVKSFLDSFQDPEVEFVFVSEIRPPSQDKTLAPARDEN